MQTAWGDALTKSDSDPSRPEGNLQPVHQHTCALGNAYKYIPRKLQKLTNKVTYQISHHWPRVFRFLLTQGKLRFSNSEFLVDLLVKTPLLALKPAENCGTRGIWIKRD